MNHVTMGAQQIAVRRKTLRRPVQWLVAGCAALLLGVAGLWLLVGIQREESGRTSLVAFAVVGVVVALGVISMVGFVRAEHESQSTTTGRVMGIVGGAVLAMVAFPAVYATLALAALAFTIG